MSGESTERNHEAVWARMGRPGARREQGGPKASKLIGAVRDLEPRGCGVLRRDRDGHGREEEVLLTVLRSGRAEPGRL